MQQNRRGVDDDLVCERAYKLAGPGLAVIGTDNDGMIVCWDEGATRLYGWSENEVVGKNVTQVTVAQSSQEEAEEVMEGLRRGECWSGNFLVKRKGGEPFIAQVQNEPVINEEGILVGFVGVSWPAD
jgi:PAS domain S-box-containing protein